MSKPTYRHLRDALNRDMTEAQLNAPVRMMLEIEQRGIVSHPYVFLAPCIFFDATEENPTLLPTTVELE